jgi:L-ascorbate metabolism protein UlaG (beta-lactamase superfamily)
MGRFDERATQPRRGFSDILRWKVIEPFRGVSGGGSESRGRRAPFVTPRREPDRGLIRSGEASATWVGHASFFLTLGGARILIDPVFCSRIGPVSRLVAPGIDLADLPDIDIVVVTHNHRDHMDPWTLKRLGAKPTYVVPIGNGAALKSLGAQNVVELDWWESTKLGELEVFIVPARHWSMRYPWDRNEALWGGCVIRSPEGTAYHSGDTAFFEEFAEIGRRVGPIDWAMLPIGAYEPRWFMEPQHMCPEEAVEAFRLLGARRFLAMHWGTFRLTDEPTGEPPERARATWKEGGGAEDDLWILDIGETRRL